MSLRVFHLFFITLATLLSFGFGGWSYENYQVQKTGLDLWLAIGGGAVGVALIVYGIWFVKKSKKIIV